MSNKCANTWRYLLLIISAVMPILPSLLVLGNVLGHFLALVSFALVPSECSGQVQAVGAWGTLAVTLGSLEQQGLAQQGSLCCFGTEENFPGYFVFAAGKVGLLCTNP